MIRIATDNYIDIICKLRILQQKEDWKEEHIDELSFYDMTKKFLENHLNKDLYIFLNIIDSKIAATCGIQIIEYLPQCNDNGRQGYICDVYTLDNYRRMGLQKDLLKTIIEFSRNKNLCELNLSSDNEIAINLYEKIGFEHDKLIMRLELSNN